MSKVKINWKESYNAVRSALERELETNKAHTKTINDQESAFRGQEATIRQLRAEAERDAKLIADKTNQINALNRRLSEAEADARTSDQNTALIEEKYKAALDIIRIISGKEGF